MADRQYIGRGAAGLKGRKKLQEDIRALSDPAKREKALERKVAKKQMVIRRKGKPQPAKREPMSPEQKIRTRAMILRLRAFKAEKGGYKRAAATYRQAARELLKRGPIKGK